MTTSSSPHALRTYAALISSAAAASLVWAASAGAQQSAGEDAQADPADPREIITVYGTSNPLPAFEYPGQVSVVTRDDIETFAPSAVSDLLRDIPGVDFAGGPRRTGEVPSIRGLSGENVLILLDGARQSFLSAHDGRFFVDPELIRSAEAVRGPASALYGSGATGGVLAFETITAEDLLQGDDVAGVRVRLGYQDVNEETFASITGYGQQGALDLVASIGLRDSGDITLGSGAELPSDDDITTGLLKGTFTVSDALTLDASWTAFRNDALEPNNGQGVTLSADPILGRDVVKDVATDTFRLGAAFNPAANPFVDARFTAYQTNTSVDEFDPTLPRTTLREIDTTGVSARNSSRFALGGADVTLTVGGDWYRDEQIGTDDNTVDGVRQGVPNGESTFAGVFVQAETVIDTPFGLPGEVLIVPGVRFDQFESESVISDAPNEDEAFSPRFAVSYGPQDWLRVFGSYSEGFRAPSINELYLTGPHFELPHPVLFDPTSFPPSFVFATNTFIPNPDLVPEKATTVEFGVGFDFASLFAPGDRFQAKASYYETEVEDLINLTVDIAFDATCFAPPFFPCGAGTTNSANIDTAELEGFEVEARYDSDRFAIRSTFASVEGVNAATGEDLGALTPDRFTLDGRVKVPAWNAALGARLQAAADFERNSLTATAEFVVEEERDGYAVVDLYATWQPDFLAGLRIDAGVDNVFDEDYDRIFQGVSEPGINPRIAISYQRGFGG